ncbi:MAG: PEP-CTERM sorting domain-containing protein, partial [Rhodospirillales bacterium]|nr:PEP-CTERM sorting domain-containing protein [Rhodospirillales bacterium]
FSRTSTTDGVFNADGTLSMTGSSLTTPELEIGTNAADTVASVSGVVELNPSYVSTDLLMLGADGDLIFHLEGTTRVTLNTAGDPGTYSAIDALDALLEGDIFADFGFTPTPGTYQFDLIVTESLTALDDTTMLPADFQVLDLPADTTVDFFGVTEANGVDVVRLSITVVPEPTSLALFVMGTLLMPTRRRRPSR